jgi:hypothetical protein
MKFVSVVFMKISILFQLPKSSVHISEAGKFVFTEHLASTGKLVNTEYEWNPSKRSGASEAHAHRRHRQATFREQLFLTSEFRKHVDRQNLEINVFSRSEYFLILLYVRKQTQYNPLRCSINVTLNLPGIVGKWVVIIWSMCEDNCLLGCDSV